MVTPFDEDGALDLDSAVAFARWLVDHGTDALVVAGTTGEATAMSDDEKVSLWEAIAGALTVPVIAGTGTADTVHSVELTRRAAQVGVDALLVVTPYYSRPSQEGIYRHMDAIASATPLPVMLYDIPARTGRRIAPETTMRLAKAVPTIVALKDAADDPVATARLIAKAPPSFEVYSGTDALTLPLLSVGAVGVVSVASNWAPAQMASIAACYTKGDVDGARKANRALLASYEFESTDRFPNPLPAKAACRALGLPVGQCREPLGSAPRELDEMAAAVLTRLGAAVA
jgi:4-hydroxy-tetrahydrodipicolinate synthase